MYVFLTYTRIQDPISALFTSYLLVINPTNDKIALNRKLVNTRGKHYFIFLILFSNLTILPAFILQRCTRRECKISLFYDALFNVGHSYFLDIKAVE